MAVPYIFGSATTSIPLSQFDSNFATAITLGNTAVYLGNTTTTIGNVTLTGVTISSGNSTVTKETVTTITSPASTALTIQSNSVTAMTIDTSQNVGIGTSSPTVQMQVYQASSDAVQRLTTGTSNFELRMVSGGTEGRISTISATPMTFRTSNVEAARFDSSGNLLVGTTSANARLTSTTSTTSQKGLYVSQTAATSNEATAAARFTKSSNTSTTGQVFIEFTINTDLAGSGQINANGASQAAFGSFSDARLKENIVDLSPQLQNICNLRPVEFDYIQSEGGGHQIGFIAQEIQNVYPEAVGKRADEMFTVTGWNKTEAILVKAIQEQQALIQSLTDRITQLEAK